MRAGDVTGAFLSHRECTCYERCPRCSVEFELDVNYDAVQKKIPDTEKFLPYTVTSVDLVSSLSFLFFPFPHISSFFALEIKQ